MTGDQRAVLHGYLRAFEQAVVAAREANEEVERRRLEVVRVTADMVTASSPGTTCESEGGGK